jgi:hypothetical protein
MSVSCQSVYQPYASASSRYTPASYPLPFWKTLGNKAICNIPNKIVFSAKAPPKYLQETSQAKTLGWHAVTAPDYESDERLFVGLWGICFWAFVY